MQVILTEDVKDIGKKGKILTCSDGYATNYLIPRKLAVEATKENLAKLKSKQNAEQHKKDLEKEEAQKLAEKIKTITLKIEVKAGENGKIFGGVTAKEISENLKQSYNIEIDKKKIMLQETIKNLGVTNVEIKLYEGISSELKVQVISK